LRGASYLPGLRSCGGGRRGQALERESGLTRHRRAGVLPRELHEVLHGGVLVGAEFIGDVRAAEGVLLQHGGDGHGSGEVEKGGVHEKNREVDGDSEE